MMNSQIDPYYDNFLTATEVLAENLACSEPIAAYNKACERLNADQTAQALLKRLGQLQSDIRIGQARGSVNKADVERLRNLQREAQLNPIIDSYAQTQQAAVAYLRQINQEISQLLGIDFAALSRTAGGCC